MTAAFSDVAGQTQDTNLGTRRLHRPDDARRRRERGHAGTLLDAELDAAGMARNVELEQAQVVEVAFVA